MKTNQLTKNSTNTEIKAYFSKILQLLQLNDEFPVNLNEVWPLVYPRKDHAVRELKENFIENIDYQVLLKNGENSKGGRPTVYYFLSVSCLEYFIARKIRPVFEVYREVFHQSVADVRIKNISNRKSESISAESMQRNIRMMHEQLFANLDGMSMLFSPMFLQINSFAWDDTRSVRANIKEFINNYYKVVIEAAMLLRERKESQLRLCNNARINIDDDYTKALVRACESFLIDALINGYDYPELRFTKKVEAARTLFIYK